ncbi:hypothetical protein AC1031_009686 [Aphanomyces cochlioides]|nr:hypothetical protein AC1031_009686 [Aphanomyces cochlioides]
MTICQPSSHPFIVKVAASTRHDSTILDSVLCGSALPRGHAVDRTTFRQPSNRAVDSPGTPRLSLDDKKAKAVAFIEEQMKRYSIPGIALSAVYKNETILAHGFGTKAHGHADIPVTADTMFQIG